MGCIPAPGCLLIGYTPLKLHIKITLADSVVELDRPVFAFSVLNGKVEGGTFSGCAACRAAGGQLNYRYSYEDSCF